MRFTLFAFLLISSWSVIAQNQPVNDECSSATSLGSVPFCEATVFTNENATTSDIGGANNVPGCFQSGNTDRDVWFTFTPTNEVTDLTITIQGTIDGPNGKPLINPQVAVYRDAGGCTIPNGLLLVRCEDNHSGDTALKFDLMGTTANVTYYLRVNDSAGSGASNSGDFTVCIEASQPIVNMGGGTTSSSACEGRLFESGGPAGNYKNNENN